MIIINKNTIYKYKKDLTSLKKLVFNCDNNIIIDTQKSQLFIDKDDIFIDSNDWKWLRKNIQLVRNTELFNLDNIDFQKKKKGKRISYDEDNPILPNRPFSYNIQNIILNFILKKLSFQESDFMAVFKKTNLYLEYEDQSREFENTKGKTIVQNIIETKNQPRSIDNSFIIEYILNQFNTDVIVDKLMSKIFSLENDKEENDNNNKIEIYQNLQKILKDYSQIKEDLSNINDNNGNNDNTNIYIRKITERNKSVLEKAKPILNINKSSKNVLRHVKNNTSLLQETSGQNKYILLGFDKDLEDSFQFYSKNGFIFFANQLDEFLKEEKIDIMEIIYKNNLNNQILNLINKSLTIDNKEKKKQSMDETKEKKKEENKLDKRGSLKNLDKKKLRQIIGVSIVPENKEEEINENNTDKVSQGSVEIKKGVGDYDFVDNFLNKNGKGKNQIFNWNPNESNDETIDIINFANFNFDEEIENDEGEAKDENSINHLMQFYLFLAFYLGKAKDDEISLKFFCDNLFSKKDTNELENEIDNNSENIETNDLYEMIENEDKESKEKERIKEINEIIIKLYIQAYKYSDRKHRDFPYFSFYNFLRQISSQDLKN